MPTPNCKVLTTSAIVRTAQPCPKHAPTQRRQERPSPSGVQRPAVASLARIRAPIAASARPLVIETSAPRPHVDAGSGSPVNRPQARRENARARAFRLDQYYTRFDVAERCYRLFRRHFDPDSFLMVEPSAGKGAFYVLLPRGSVGVDLDPKHPGVTRADFLKVELPTGRPIAVIGNPPYGRNSNTAVRFFNRAARRADVIAFVLPRTFRKASIQNRLDPAFHLLLEEEMPGDSFIFEGIPRDVPTIFQIWVRRAEPRARRLVETTHPDFEFTTPDRADFAIQRIGARAGRLHHEFSRSPSSHLFIRVVAGDVEEVMSRIDFGRVARDTAGNPSVAKSEIVALYRAEIETGQAARATERPRPSARPDTRRYDRRGGSVPTTPRTDHAAARRSTPAGGPPARRRRRASPRSPPACRRPHRLASAPRRRPNKIPAGPGTAGRASTAVADERPPGRARPARPLHGRAAIPARRSTSGCAAPPRGAIHRRGVAECPIVRARRPEPAGSRAGGGAARVRARRAC